MEKLFGKGPVRIGAQAYLRKFYEDFGFVQEGEEYLEDGIPHIITAHSLDPALIPKVFACSSTLNGAGPLAWPERELVNAITSRLNQCLY